MSKSKVFALENEEQYMTLLKENKELKIQVAQLAEQLEISANRLEQLTAMMQSDEDKKRKEMEEMKSYARVKDLEMQV